jgi:hypothetical protein
VVSSKIQHRGRDDTEINNGGVNANPLNKRLEQPRRREPAVPSDRDLGAEIAGARADCNPERSNNGVA